MLRTILLIVGVLIIVGIAIDGWRRKQGRLKQTREKEKVVIESPEILQVKESSAVSATEPLPSLTKSSSTQVQERVPTEVTLHEQLTLLPITPPLPVTSDVLDIESGDPVDLLTDEAGTDLPVSVRPEHVKSANQAMPKPKPVPESAPTRSDVISLTVMSVNARAFAGYDIINALKENHLHHGAYDIYHRYKYRNGKGPLYFSVASVIKPGSINPRKVGELSTPGLILFMSLDNPKHDRIVFKQILATAHQLAKRLGGVVCDDRRIPLRESTLDVYADRINL